MKQFRGLRCFSTRKIPVGTYHQHGKDYLIRKDLVDTRWLPNNQVVLPKADPLGVNFAETKLAPATFKDHRIQQLVKAISTKSNTAYDRFESLLNENSKILAELSPIQCSSLLRLVTTGSNTDEHFWTKSRKLVHAMQDAGHELKAQDYTRLIHAAFRAGRFDSVQNLWNEVNELGIPKTTALYNNYIMATCNGQPWQWKEMKFVNNRKQQQTAADMAELEPPVINDTLELFQQMGAEGVQPDARTHELLILYFAKKGDLDAVKTVLSTVWGGMEDNDSYSSRLARHGSAVQPNASTLSNIIHAFAINKKLTKGLRYIDWMQRRYQIRLDDRKALHTWTVCLYWAFVDSSSPRRVFTELWNSVVNKYKLEPTSYMFYLRLRYLKSRSMFRHMVRDIDLVYRSRNVADQDFIASLYVHRAARSMLHHGRKTGALNLVNQWSAKAPVFGDVERLILKHLHTSTRPQRALERRVSVLSMERKEREAYRQYLSSKPKAKSKGKSKRKGKSERSRRER